MPALRTVLHRALTSPLGNGFRPLRVVKELLGTANDLVGRPLCSAEELAARRQRDVGGPRAATRDPAPVMVYFDGRDQRSKIKIEELLKARDIAYKILDVSDDEASLSWAKTQAKLDELPLVFVAGEAIGGLHELTHADVNGTLKRKVFGA